MATTYSSGAYNDQRIVSIIACSRLLITYAISLYPEQDRPEPFETLIVFLKDLILKTVDSRKQKHLALTNMQKSFLAYEDSISRLACL